jgi:hypothetical protein
MNVEVKQGQKIRVEMNSIHLLMGFKALTGTVFLVTERAIHFQCNETGSMEFIERFPENGMDGRVSVNQVTPRGNDE